jgi:hypothetical protein
MQIYSTNLKGPLKVSGYIDPDDTTEIRVFWNAPVFTTQTVYRAGDITRPSIDNGYYYQCSINGVSGINEPTWTQEETISGTVTFMAVPWNLWLMPRANISSSLWSSSNTDITLSSEFYNHYYTSVLVSNVPNTLMDFTLTNQISNENSEFLSRSFTYKINQQ